MIKRFCDMCKKEVDIDADMKKAYFGLNSYPVELCQDCFVKWDRFKTKLKEKYAPQYEALDKQREKEIKIFLMGEMNE